MIYHLHITLNYEDGHERDWEHEGLSADELMTFVRSYLRHSNTASLVFTVTKKG